MLHRELSGKGDPLVLIHGFTQSARSWGTVAGPLAETHTVIAVDAPGHGQSADIAADLWNGADLLASAAGGAADSLGYSMGGRFALHVALRHPEMVRRLVVVSATGGIDDAGERAARRRSDEELAQQVERDGVPAFVEWWLARPMFASLPAGAAGVEQRLGNTAHGLASSLRLAGTGRQQPLWRELGQLDMPVLVIAGQRDPAYEAHGRRLVASIGANASLNVIEGAGHACHLEAPEAFLEAVERFLEHR